MRPAQQVRADVERDRHLEGLRHRCQLLGVVRAAVVEGDGAPSVQRRPAAEPLRELRDGHEAVAATPQAADLPDERPGRDEETVRVVLYRYVTDAVVDEHEKSTQDHSGG